MSQEYMGDCPDLEHNPVSLRHARRCQTSETSEELTPQQNSETPRNNEQYRDPES